jgi:hypothetical protein
MSSTRTETLERERRWARPAGLAAILIAPLFILSLYLEGSSAALGEVLPSEQYRLVDEDAAQLLPAYIAQGLALALSAVPLLYLFAAAQARSERVRPAMLGFALIGPLLYAAALILTNLARTQVASDFVAQAAAGGDIYSLLEEVGEDSTILTIGSTLFLPAALGMVVAMVYICLHAQRVGLLSRFFGSLGMALGVLLLLINPRFSLLVLSIWFGWLGFLILDRTPRGRPPAWAVGEAVPLLRPGQEAAEPLRPPAPDGDAAEVLPGASSTASKDRSARRERARKRKRKRRT